MQNQNLKMAKELFEAWYRGDAEVMIKTYHPELIYSINNEKPRVAEEAIYLHLANHYLSKNVDVCDPEPEFSIIDDNTIKVRYKMFVYRKNGKHTFHWCNSNYTFKDNRIYREVLEYSDWMWWCKAHGLKGFLIGWTNAANRNIEKKLNAFEKKFRAKQPVYKIKPLAN